MQVAFIGCGNMGSALLHGVMRSGLVDSLCLCNRTLTKAEMLASSYPQAKVSDSATLAAAGANVLILALEPQGVLPVLSELAGVIAQTQPLVISVAAGVPLSSMQAIIPTARLVRMMPNTAVAIGEGVCGFICGEHCHATDADCCHQLFGQTGLCVELQTEDDIQAVVSLAGSAPAFFYEILDAMTKQGTAQGLTPELSLQLAAQAMKGAAALQQQTGKSPNALRNAITSPNGATLTGLRRLNSLKIKEHWQTVMQASSDRLREMDAQQS